METTHGAIQVFYINRDCDLERRAHIEKQLDRLGLLSTRIRGVDGRAVPEWLNGYYDDRLTPGEVGCSASHLTACAAIRDSNLPYAVILEDDAELTDDFEQTVLDAVRIAPRSWDVIRLTRPGKNALQIIAKTSTNHSLIRYSKIPVSAAGLMVSYAGAKKLLRPRLIKEPIDSEIRYPWQLDLNVLGIAPGVVAGIAPSIIRSTIEVRSKSRSSNKIIIGINRVAYNVRTIGILSYLMMFMG